MRTGVLGDYTYIMDTAWRIAQGDVMYRDFGLPHSPLTFHVQATLIKLFGFSYQLTAWYCTLVNVVYVLLTYRLLQLLLPAWSAVGVCLPLVWLAPHAIYPHPFYDPDACLLVLLNLNLLHWVATTRVSPAVAFLCGLTTILPALTKQNVGYPYLGLIAVSVVWWGWLRDQVFRENPDGARTHPAYPEVLQSTNLRWFFYGLLGGMLLSLWWLMTTCGLENYFYWVFVSASHRLARPTLMETYGTLGRWLNGVVLILGWWLWRLDLLKTTPRWFRTASLALLLGPFVVVLMMTLFVEHYFIEFNYPLLSLWVSVMALTAFVGAGQFSVAYRSSHLLWAVVPWVALSVAFFSFLSQGHVRSSYGIWVCFALMMAYVVTPFIGDRRLGVVCWSWGILLTLAAVPYIQKNIRLRHINIDRSKVMLQKQEVMQDTDVLRHINIDRSKVMQQTVVVGPLRGFTTFSPQLSDFAELLEFVDRHIPETDAVVCVPQEDPFYVVTGRRNPLPMVIFDKTATPFPPEVIVEQAEQHQVSWVILKAVPQMRILAMDNQDTAGAFLKRYSVVARLNGYIILHRSFPAKADSL
ncbi:MAG: hypothetical protein ACUVR8_11525 [Acidobacteriota bacterium]